MKGAPIFLALAALVMQTGPARAAGEPDIDYDDAGNWLCRPGQTECSSGLAASRLEADGSESVVTFQADPDAPVDCFYVYPTVSKDPGEYSDMDMGPEELAIARSQAGRLSSQCRLFAPKYRQLTLAALRRAATTGKFDFDPPYADIVAAWRSYLKNDNHGRGIVLVGHSQGTFMLQRLIAEEIDGKPVQSQLVLALLGGNSAIPVPRGQLVGGEFKHIEICSRSGQSGCVFTWASYEQPLSPVRFFGHAVGGDQVAACSTPARPEGGPAVADAFIPLADVPDGQPRFLEVPAGITVACETDAGGSAMVVSLEDGPNRARLRSLLSSFAIDPAWGLHRMDLFLVQGDMIRRIAEARRTWADANPGRGR